MQAQLKIIAKDKKGEGDIMQIYRQNMDNLDSIVEQVQIKR